jgi:hypothetical protein
MSWTGIWKNQYGSIVEITSDADGRIEGTFRTALEDSAFYGQDVALAGMHRGNCIAFASVGSGTAGDMIVSYTGLLRDGKMETIWLYAADAAIVAKAPGEPGERAELSWWKAVTTNADTFVRE